MRVVCLCVWGVDLTHGFLYKPKAPGQTSWRQFDHTVQDGWYGCGIQGFDLSVQALGFRT